MPAYEDTQDNIKGHPLLARPAPYIGKPESNKTLDWHKLL